MGVVYRKIIRNECMLGIWKITEDYESLISGMHLDEQQYSILNGFKSRNRKVEWLSVRALLYDLLHQNKRILYNGDRRPYLQDHSYNISISHSKDLTSILLSKDCRVGLDLEHMTHRIASISHKFINTREVVSSDPDKKTYHLYVHWCAKEALFKICRQKSLNFKEDITIEPFQPEEEGMITGRVITSRGNENYRLNYFRIENYSIVWCCKNGCDDL